MATADPNIILQSGQGVPKIDLMADTLSALKIASEIGDIKSAQSDRSENQKMNNAIKGLDPNDPTFDDKAVAAMHAAGVSPAKILQFKSDQLKTQLTQTDIETKRQKANDEHEAAIAKLPEEQLKASEARSGQIANMANDVANTYDRVVGDSKDPAVKIQAQTLAKQVALNHIEDSIDNGFFKPEDGIKYGLKNGIIDVKGAQQIIQDEVQSGKIKPEDAKKLTQQLQAQKPPQFNIETIRTIGQDSDNYNRQVKQRLETAQADKAEAEATKAKNAANDAEPLTPQGAALLFDLGRLDSSTFSRLSAGGMAQRNKAINDWAMRGYTAQDIVAERAGTKLTNKEAMTLGTQKANLEVIEKHINDTGGLGDQVLASAKTLKGDDLRVYNSFSQLLGANISSGPLADYQIKIGALRDELASVINKGGQPTDASRAQATSMIDKYQPNAAPAMVKAIKQVIASRVKAMNESAADVGAPNPEAKSDNKPGSKSDETPSVSNW